MAAIIKLLTVCVATVDMGKGILQGTAKVETTHYTLKRSTALCCRSLDGSVVSGLLMGSFECNNTGCFQNTVPERTEIYEVCPESSWTTCPQLNLNHNKFLHLYHHIQECIRNTCVKNDKDTTSDMSFTMILLYAPCYPRGSCLFLSCYLILCWP